MPTYFTHTYLPTYLLTLNPKGKFDAKVRVRSAGRNPFALHAVWMKAGENKMFSIVTVFKEELNFLRDFLIILYVMSSRFK